MGRAPCCDKQGLKKGPWTPEEDQKLVDYIQKNGQGGWRILPKNAGLARCGKSCRLRWTNYLRPDIRRGRFSFEEEETIIHLHSILGNKWSAIASQLPGRTDNEIKNYWNTHIRKRLMRMGIDPVTHSLRLDLLDLSALLTPPFFNPVQPDVSRMILGGPQVNLELLQLAAGLVSPQFQYPISRDQDSIVMNQIERQASIGQLQNSDAWQLNQFESNPIHHSLVPSLSYFAQSDQTGVVLGDPSHGATNDLANSGSSTPAASSPTMQLNYSSSTTMDSRANEDSRSFCSDLFSFQIPLLMDASDML